MTPSYRHIQNSFFVALLVFPSIMNAAECEFDKDEFKGTESVTVSTKSDFVRNPAQIILLYSVKDDIESYSFAGFFVYDDWKFLGVEAYDIDKTKLEHISATRDTLSRGKVIESVQIAVSKAYFQSHASTGIKLRIYGSKGHEDMKIGSALITDFLSCLGLADERKQSIENSRSDAVKSQLIASSRTPNTIGSIVILKIDGKTISRAQSSLVSAMESYSVEPGVHQIVIAPTADPQNEKSVTIDVKPGVKYYLGWNESEPAIWKEESN